MVKSVQRCGVGCCSVLLSQVRLHDACLTVLKLCWDAQGRASVTRLDDTPAVCIMRTADMDCTCSNAHFRV